MAMSSACCSHVDSPGRDGQSMFATLATQAPRNSRATGGASTWAPIPVQGSTPTSNEKARIRSRRLIERMCTQNWGQRQHRRASPETEYCLDCHPRRDSQAFDIARGAYQAPMEPVGPRVARSTVDQTPRSTMTQPKTDSGTTISAWMPTAEIPSFPRLAADAECDVCIVGAGIAGLTTAYTLARAGKSVIVLDDGPIGCGETG